jgi:DNA-binding beta-propeller fold protein YncE
MIQRSCSEKLWEFQDVVLIREPRGVAVDRDLNVYVVSTGNNSVVVISPDGKRCRTVLGKSDGIDRPTAICFDKVKNNLVAFFQINYDFVFFDFFNLFLKELSKITNYF